MVSGPFLGLVALFLLVFGAGARPLQQQQQQHLSLDPDVDDSSVRNERSTNISRLTGTARMIQLIIMDSMLLQILPGGTVRGTEEDNNYTIVQRISVGFSQVKIQGVTTCLYLCMDSCGLLYSSKTFKSECIFNEQITENYRNTYSSVEHSTSNRKYFAAVNSKGKVRKAALKTSSNKTRTLLGKMAKYTQFLPVVIKEDRRDELLKKLLDRTEAGDPHRIRHQNHQLCQHGSEEALSVEDPDDRDRPSCRKRKPKKKKKRKKCKEGEDEDKEECQKRRRKGKNSRHKKNRGDRSGSDSVIDNNRNGNNTSSSSDHPKDRTHGSQRERQSLSTATRHTDAG